jgi:SEC-C motif-containing protein
VELAVALLGLTSLTAEVEVAFERGLVGGGNELADFESDIAYALEHPNAPWQDDNDYVSFDDTIGELSEFAGGGDEDEFDFEAGDAGSRTSGTVVNPLRHVGRNDPCPCGSGKKFKKCCLNVLPAPTAVSETVSENLDDELYRYEYDPLDAPDPDEWQALDEQERISAVEAYHRRERIRLPNATVHATLHVIGENQIALGDETPAQRTLERLMAEGLDRHDAIHAIGSELMMHMSALLSGGPVDSSDPNKPYYAALERLTARKWLRTG